MLGMTLRDAGWEVVEAHDWAQAVAAAQDGHFDAVLADLWMPQPDREALAAVRAATAGAVLAIMSSLQESETREVIAGVGGVDLVLSKRQAPHELVAALGAARAG
jgi:DNA-binding response OmpR family regulator